MLEKDFQQLAEKTLNNLADALEEMDTTGELELDYQNDIINITLDSGKQFIINKHAPSQQIWLSSPISGGSHFSYDAISDSWQLADGRELGELLMAELKCPLINGSNLKEYIACYGYGMGGVWYRMLAASSDVVRRAFPQFTVYDKNPDWFVERPPHVIRLHKVGDPLDDDLKEIIAEAASQNSESDKKS